MDSSVVSSDSTYSDSVVSSVEDSDVSSEDVSVELSSVDVSSDVVDSVVCSVDSVVSVDDVSVWSELDCVSVWLVSDPPVLVSLVP